MTTHSAAKTVAFVPMKMNNERLPGKNTKLLGGSIPLYHLILRSLTRVEGIDAVYVYCSDPELGDLPEGVKYLRRSVDLDQPTTPINEVMRAFASDVPADIYLLAHATAPFLSTSSLDRIAAAVRDDGYDSAMAVTAMQEFLWKGGSPVNYDPASVPRTQDLEPYFVETTGAYSYTKELVAEGRRIGRNPKLVQVAKLEAIDINGPEDWIIADAVFAATSSSR